MQYGKKKEVKEHTDGKGRNKTLLADDIIVYMGTFKEPTKETPRTVK